MSCAPFSSCSRGRRRTGSRRRPREMSHRPPRPRRPPPCAAMPHNCTGSNCLRLLWRRLYNVCTGSSSISTWTTTFDNVQQRGNIITTHHFKVLYYFMTINLRYQEFPSEFQSKYILSFFLF
jgi:hypothetical protein